MPQASDELRETMRRWFGSGIDEAGPELFLRSHGFKLRKDWQWELPTPAHTVSCYEFECVQFLIDEWDMGNIVDWDGRNFACLCGFSTAVGVVMRVGLHD